jgi:hypothetical protein
MVASGERTRPFRTLTPRFTDMKLDRLLPHWLRAKRARRERLRDLQAQLRAEEAKWVEYQGPDDEGSVGGILLEEDRATRGLRNQIWGMENASLIRTAERFGVPHGEIWTDDGDGSLQESPEGRDAVRRAVQQARFQYWKMWADILVPVLSLVVSVISVLVALMALSR